VLLLHAFFADFVASRTTEFLKPCVGEKSLTLAKKSFNFDGGNMEFDFEEKF